jgi:hypothetical protein
MNFTVDNEINGLNNNGLKNNGLKNNGGLKNNDNDVSGYNVIMNKKILHRLRSEFNDRLIVIDEVHNIRKTDDNSNKKVAINLEILVKAVNNLRFVFLSATPMYNSYKEIIWLLNIMNINDKRGKIEVKDVFDKFGKFKKDGEELLMRKATGYVSFVRGENPYTFPYRVYPNIFAPNHTFLDVEYPSYQMNLKKIKHADKKRILSLYLNIVKNCGKCGDCQACAYKYIIHQMRNKNYNIITKTGLERNMATFENMESFGYTLLQTPIEALIISYPIDELKNVIQNISDNEYSDEYSESFSDIESKDNDEDEIDEIDETNKIQENKIQENKIQENFTFDSHLLTGKKGITRIMSFVESLSPPVKGSYEYKKTTLTNYGKIFSYDKIQKYSVKIKTVLENIYNKEKDKVSDGIILIYSQYIDSGLIPMALALEEMGFIRYGENIKSLFKNPPTDVVDVKTMKKPINVKDFKPARYSMITGDQRLSPNNDFEVKGLTGEDNVNGEKIKVILISKAGSEGIDLKFIRQVHILDPWYNMNRIEQIIGRAVRNFSHKDLPFEKRNVEIFMHSTIFEENNREETADLYIYRVAEYKAIQIGKVTRLLKETAVDCLLNQEQTNFTQKKIEEIIKTKFEQKLSNGMIITDFKIGDAPFSPACDFMADCNYSCIPFKNITTLNEDTYNESFIIVNSDKIFQKIKMLMKESFFYKKDMLIKAIRTPKEYPYSQIYYCLTQLIDENEMIVDKYGRNGTLINIGEYYLFQPIELKYKNISLFDRSVPIDYKHSAIEFEINKNNEVVNNVNKVNHITEMEGLKIINKLKENFSLTQEYTTVGKVIRGEDNWFKHCGVAMNKIREMIPESNEYLSFFLVSHMAESLLYENKIHVMDYLSSLETMEENSFEWLLKSYFDKISIKTKNEQYIILYKLNQMVVLKLELMKWVELEPEDKIEFMKYPETSLFTNLDVNNFNTIVGFLGYTKQINGIIFKTKNLKSSRDTGARCDEAGKKKIIIVLNEILGEEKFTNENTKQVKEKNIVIKETIGQIEICVLLEFILRYFNEIEKNNKKWFITPEYALFHKMYKVIP